MPLKAGKENVGLNIRELLKAGHTRSQAIAASLSKARESLKGNKGKKHKKPPKS